MKDFEVFPEEKTEANENDYDFRIRPVTQEMIQCLLVESPIIPKTLSKNESDIVERLKAWRAQVAAFDDESPEYVLTDELIYIIE